jgi:hypothetical protein
MHSRYLAAAQSESYRFSSFLRVSPQFIVLASCSISAACQHHRLLIIILATTQKATMFIPAFLNALFYNVIIEKVDSVTNLNHGQNM